MARFGTYPKEDFDSNQNFLARNPTDSGQVIRVQGQGILDAAVAEIEQSGKVVQSIDTLTEAIATDYQSGTYVLTGGGLVTLDGDQSIYRVSDPGSGGIVMDNGNELVLLFQANAGDAGNFNVGTASGEIPLNSDLGDASLATLTTSETDTTGALRAEDAYNIASINWHDANLNPLEFGANASGDTVALGIATAATTAVFYLPISEFSAPASITVTNTFSVVNSNGGTVSGGGTVTPTLSGSTSFKMVALNVGGLSGMTSGDVLRLNSNAAASKITVNP